MTHSHKMVCGYGIFENLTKYFVDLHISLESKIFTYYCIGKIFHQSTYNNEYIVLVDGEVKDLITI